MEKEVQQERVEAGSGRRITDLAVSFGVVPLPGESELSLSRRLADWVKPLGIRRLTLLEKEVGRPLHALPISDKIRGVARVECCYGLRPWWVPTFLLAGRSFSLQPAETWVLEEIDTERYFPICIFGRSNGSFVSVDEVVAHELIHASRGAFNDEFKEEWIAYQVFSSRLYRWLGPFLGSRSLAWLTAVFALGSVIAVAVSLFLSY